MRSQEIATGAIHIFANTAILGSDKNSRFSGCEHECKNLNGTQLQQHPCISSIYVLPSKSVKARSRDRYSELAAQFPDPPDEPTQPVPFDWRLFKPIMRQLRDPDPSWWNDLPRITAPTLIIAGGSTSHVPQDKLAEVAQLIPDCRLVTFEGAGHTVHQNRPEEYKALLRDFLFK